MKRHLDAESASSYFPLLTNLNLRATINEDLPIFHRKSEEKNLALLSLYFDLR